MKTQDLTKYSIKYKIKQINSMVDDDYQLLIPQSKESQWKIYQLQHQNYFINVIEKQIKHEDQILNKIKDKIYMYKRRQNNKQNQKDVFSYTHYYFINRTPQSIKKYNKKIVKKAADINFKGIFNKVKNSGLAAEQSKDSEQKNQNRPKSSCFLNKLKSHQDQDLFNKELEVKRQYPLKQNYRKGQKVNKNQVFKRSSDEFTITGKCPLWSNFESYHQRYTSQTIQSQN